MNTSTPHQTPDDVSSQSPGKAHTSSRKGRFLHELINIALIAVFIVLPIRLFIAQPFIVSGSSMVPTFESGDYLIVDQLTYQIEKPERGEVVIFRYPNDPSKFFIKRVIGLPGETVSIQDGVVRVINEENPQGFMIEEPYIETISTEALSVTLGAEEYFVLGDNRTASSDSRVWGPLPRDFIVGRALLRLFPVGDAGLLPGEYIIE